MGKRLVPVCGGGLEIPPDYHALARQLAELSQEMAARAEEDGDDRLERTAARIGACAASMMSDLRRSGA